MGNTVPFLLNIVTFMKSTGRYLSYRMGIVSTHRPQGPDKIATPAGRKIGFGGNLFCGKSMCLMDIISDFKQ